MSTPMVAMPSSRGEAFHSKNLGLSAQGWRANLSIAWAVFIARMRTIRRYKGFLIMEILLPTLFAALPILLGNAIAGSSKQAAANFQDHTKTASYVAYMIIGANVFMMVSGAMWNFGMWMRREQQTGTLESLLLSPASKAAILSGTALYISIRTSISFFIAFIFGCLAFGVPLEEIFAGNILLALIFIYIGMIPVYGLSFLFGALIMEIKEASSLVNLLQWVISLLMGIFFPITILPSWLQFVAKIFPPSWMNNDVRSSLLDLSYFMGSWYLDLAVLFAFCLILPMVGLWIFSRAEKHVKRNQGLGQF
ncbi:MAG: ABC transporter permease [Candidatus Heimdallarchaeota archaeon]